MKNNRNKRTDKNKKAHGKASKNIAERRSAKGHTQGKAAKAPSKNYEQQEPRLKPASLYGFHAVREAFLNPERKIGALYCTDNGLASFNEIISSAAKAGLNRPEPMMVSKDQLERALPEGAVHQGIALLSSPLEEMNLEDVLIRHKDAQESLIVILDQVTDPHNVGAILRSACAFGANALVMQSKHAPELTGVLAKTACGAIEHVDVAYETNLSRAIEELQAAGYFVYGLDERGDDITKARIPEKATIVMGAEGPGIRRLVKEHCDQLLALPMHGPMRSINVSNAAAVTLHEFANRRR